MLLFKSFFKTHKRKEITKICHKYQIYDFTINDDMSVSVDYDVRLKIETSKLPIKFKEVKGDFDCSSIGLETLEGCPEIVDGDFDCSFNSLKSLELSRGDK